MAKEYIYIIFDGNDYYGPDLVEGAPAFRTQKAADTYIVDNLAGDYSLDYSGYYADEIEVSDA